MTQNNFPKNGPLSGMILTALSALIVIPLGLFYAPFAEKFNHPVPKELLNYFFLSIVIMAVHKIESFFAGEYDQCPVYLSSGETLGNNSRKIIFLSFVPTFIGMLFFAYLAFLGAPWHLMLITVWLGQGLHEIHHLGKSLARKRAYPGVYSSLLFVTVMSFAVFPLWYDLVLGERGTWFYVYYLILPLVLLSFYIEDRVWFKKALSYFPTLTQKKSGESR